MTLIKQYAIAKDINLEDFIKIKQMAMEDLLTGIAKHEIEMDRPYKIVFKDSKYECFGDSYFPEIENRKMAVDFEPIPQVRMVFKSPEDLHLIPSKSLRTRLKNCWRYLWDDTNGQYEAEK